MTKFRIVLVGTLPQHTKKEAEEAIKDGLALSFRLHDALEDTVIELEPEETIEDMKGRFKL